MASAVASAAVDHVTQVTIDELKELIKSKPSENAMMVWGPPGSGKSAAFEQAAKEDNANLVVELLSTKAPEDIEGVPFPRAEPDGEMTTYFAPPSRFAPLFRADCPKTYLFLDELNTAQQHVQVVVMELALKKRVGGRTLSPNVQVFAAGNRMTDRCAVNPMPKSLEGRFEHYEVVINPDVWIKWANENQIDPAIIAFIRTHPGKLMDFDPDSASPAFASPRSYERLNRRIEKMGWDNSLFPKVAGANIGEGVAAQLIAYRMLKDEIPDPRLILKNGLEFPVPKAQELAKAHFLISALAAHVFREPTHDHVLQSLRYVTRMPVELGSIYCRDILLNKSKARNFVLSAFNTDPHLIKHYKDKWERVLLEVQKESGSSVALAA